jgi:quercetin dioxygenase-like cupin family protein
MDIARKADRNPQPGPAAWFTGRVTHERLTTARPPSRVNASLVRFEPGARTAWHTHPLGQTLYVVSGAGWAQIEGSPRQDIREGDVVWFPPLVRHWHGAAATTAMSHIAIQEEDGGRAVDWLEQVSDDDYTRG